MKNQNQPVEPERLVEAAIAVLQACTEYAAGHDGRSVHPTELLGSGAEGRLLVPFTRYEVEEATMFLMRLGYLEQVRRAAQG